MIQEESLARQSGAYLTQRFSYHEGAKPIVRRKSRHYWSGQGHDIAIAQWIGMFIDKAYLSVRFPCIRQRIRFMLPATGCNQVACGVKGINFSLKGIIFFQVLQRAFHPFIHVAGGEVIHHVQFCPGTQVGSQLFEPCINTVELEMRKL
ncbi:MAG: hypothetical protein ACD_23C00907G0003 [uncultured bacterium]|nr:MAG: hypothetical protein ACD_23C00907G0003 [uncultured bacterium]